MRLQARILFFSIPIAAGSLAAVFFLSRHAVHTVVMEEAARRGFSKMKSLEEKLRPAYQARSEKDLLPELLFLQEQMGAAYAMALDKNGRVIAHTNVAQKGRVYTDPASRRHLVSDKPLYAESLWEGVRVLDAGIPLWSLTEGEDFLISGGRPDAALLGYLRIGMPLESILETEWRILYGILWVVLAAMLVSLGLILIYIRRIIYPIRLLAEAAAEIGGGRLGITVPVICKDEIGELAGSFNRMSKVLAETTVSKDFLSRYEFIANTSKDLMALIDKNGRYEAVNRAYALAHGKAPEKLIGMPMEGAWSPEVFSEKIQAPFAGCIFGQEIHFEAWLKFVSQEERYYEIGLYPFRVSGGRVTHVVAVMRDATERRQAGEQLELFRRLVDQSNDAIYVINPENAHFMDVNEKACQDTGYSRQELLRLSVMDVDPNIPNQEAWNGLLQEARVRGYIILESRGSRKNGSTYPIEVNAKYVAHAGQDYLVAVVRDTTDRKQLEEQLLQSGKLAAVGELAGGVAHELNNPLGSILGASDILEAEVPPDNKWHQDIAVIRQAAERAKKIITSLLGFARRHELNIEALDLHSVLDNTLALCGNQLKLAGVQVKKKYFPGHLLVQGNASQLQQVFLNLILNAADAMPSGGSLVISAYPHENGSSAVVSFKDSGTGIPPEILSKIFDPFFTTKEVGKGTGLGLSLGLGIIGKHGGRLEAFSEGPGRGSVFMVTLPLSLSGLKKEVSYERKQPA